MFSYKILKKRNIDNVGYKWRISGDIVYARGLLKVQMSKMVKFEKEGGNIFGTVNYKRKKFIIIKRFYYTKFHLSINKDFFDNKQVKLSNWTEIQDFILTIIFTRFILSLYVANYKRFEDVLSSTEEEAANEAKKLLEYIEYNEKKKKWQIVDNKNLSDLNELEMSILNENIKEINMLAEGNKVKIMDQMDTLFILIKTIEMELNGKISTNYFYKKTIYEEIVQHSFSSYFNKYKEIQMILMVHELTTSKEKTIVQIFDEIQQTPIKDIINSVESKTYFLIKSNFTKQDFLAYKISLYNEAFFCYRWINRAELLDKEFLSHVEEIKKDLKDMANLYPDYLSSDLKINSIRQTLIDIFSGTYGYNIIKIKGAIKQLKTDLSNLK